MPSVPSDTTSPVCGLNTSTPDTLTVISPPPMSVISTSGSPKTTNRLPAAGGLEILGHVQVGVHPRLQHRHPAELVELGGMGIVVEGAGDQDVEAGVSRLTGGGDEIGARHRAELRADEDAGATLAVSLHEPPLGADEVARPAGEARKGDAVFLVRLLHTGACAGSR